MTARSFQELYFMEHDSYLDYDSFLGANNNVHMLTNIHLSKDRIILTPETQISPSPASLLLGSHNSVPWFDKVLTASKTVLRKASLKFAPITTVLFMI
ncbi:hypothetical protein AVEN_88369-1 [Araneus ventricosus]|uniref:Uncharacterized protein n=1 Tax=Araneus ventricosus TaxID=182803 RepID=A0A4Y2IBN5_ARAVE|nr:hypothetical protein AVEN_88369-1 [Araneus ventricosus]